MKTGILLFAGGAVIVICIILYILHSCKTVKMRQTGIPILGKKVSFRSIPGRPPFYIITVEYMVNNENFQKKIVTTDAMAQKFERESEIQLVYVPKLKRVFWAEERISTIRTRCIVLGIMGAGILCIAVSALVLRQMQAPHEDWSPYEINEQGTLVQAALEYMGTIEAEPEEYFGYTQEFLERATFWWQIRSRTRYQTFKEMMGLKTENFPMNFEQHNYIFVYGRPLKEFYYDTGYTYCGLPYTIAIYDREEPYTSGLVYAYEMEKVSLEDPEWGWGSLTETELPGR